MRLYAGTSADFVVQPALGRVIKDGELNLNPA